jgi:cytochrome b subunit of formate dehydrogenase
MRPPGLIAVKPVRLNASETDDRIHANWRSTSILLRRAGRRAPSARDRVGAKQIASPRQSDYGAGINPLLVIPLYLLIVIAIAFGVVLIAVGVGLWAGLVFAAFSFVAATVAAAAWLLWLFKRSDE